MTWDVRIRKSALCRQLILQYVVLAKEGDSTAMGRVVLPGQCIAVIIRLECVGRDCYGFLQDGDGRKQTKRTEWERGW